jgi:hypothetical protein
LIRSIQTDWHDLPRRLHWPPDYPLLQEVCLLLAQLHLFMYLFMYLFHDTVFPWHNPFGRTTALGSTQHLTEMSTSCISWGGKGDRCVGLTILPPYADCLEILGASTLRACPGMFRDSFRKSLCTVSSGWLLEGRIWNDETADRSPIWRQNHPTCLEKLRKPRNTCEDVSRPIIKTSTTRIQVENVTAWANTSHSLYFLQFR